MVTVIDVDQPYLCGHLEPAEGFGEIAGLLERLARNRQQILSPAIKGVSAEKRAARQRVADEYSSIQQEFVSPGLKMFDAETGELLFEPLQVEVDERGFWWGGHMWRDGKRII
jgi:hypothetical protein